MRNHLSGLIAAPYTALHADGSVNLDRIEQQAELLLESGVQGAFVCGTTGEYASLRVDERLRIAERWCAVAGRELPIIVHVGHNCLADAQELASHAARVGAQAIAALAPSYFKPAAVEDLLTFCAAVAAAAPDLPFYYYDIPGMTGVRLPAAEFLHRGGERIPSLAGVKFSHSDLFELQQCLRVRDGAFDVLCGSDELLLAAWALGCNGAVGSTYNYAAPVYQCLLRAFEAGNHEAARAEQAKVVELVRALVQFGVFAAGKAIMGMLGVDCGPLRPPLANLSAEQVRALRARLAALNVFARPLR